MPDITSIFSALERGDRAAAQLWPLVYDELRRLAGQLMVHERPGQTLDATALVHEAYLRLAGADAEAAELARLHVFGGLSIEEAGAALGLARATAYRNWSFARAWLRAALQG